MYRVTPVLVVLAICLLPVRCSKTDSVTTSVSGSGNTSLAQLPADLTLPAAIRLADSLIQWRAFPEAKQVLAQYLESPDNSVQHIPRARNLWCYALLRNRDTTDYAIAIQMLNELERSNPQDTLIQAQCAFSKGHYYYAVWNLDSAAHYFSRALDYFSICYTTDNPVMQRYFRDIGSFYLFELEKLQEALEIFRKEEALHAVWRFPPRDRVLNGYNLGTVYRFIEEYDLAESYQHQAIMAMRETEVAESALAILPYASLCYLSAQKNDALTLHTYIDTTLDLVNKHYAKDTANLIDYYCSMAMCYIPGHVRDPARGLRILEMLPVDAEQIPGYEGAYGEFYRAKAYLQLGRGDMSAAQDAMQTAIGFYRKARPLDSYYRGGYQDALLGLGVFFLEDGKQVHKAMPHIREAMNLSFALPFEFFAEKYPVRFLKYYGRWYDYLLAHGDHWIATAHPTEVLPGLLKLSARIDSAIISTRQKVSNHDALRNSRLNHDIYSYMIGWYHVLYRKYPQDTLLAQVFDHFEKSRAHLLLTQLSTRVLAQKMGVPEEIIEEGIALTKEELATAALLEEFEIDSLLARKQKYFQLLRDSYPDYYYKSYQPDRVTLKEVQQQIVADEAMICYQLREADLYTLVITTDTVVLAHARFSNECVNASTSLYAQVRTRPAHAWDARDVLAYSETASEVFECVLGSIFPLIREKKQWWIAADGVLELLPLELLVNENPGDTRSFASLPYLVNDYNIGYILSATTWAEARKHRKPQIEKIAAFVHSEGVHTISTPGLQTKHVQYQGMPGTAAAATSIRNVFGGSNIAVYPNSKATIAAFVSTLNEYDVLHLGLHAFADTTLNQLHGIVFPGDNEPLTVSDIIGHRIGAYLVFLEGCETGLGLRARGEGMLSFARPFIAAGARHVLASRWKLDDQTAGQTAGYFYQSLSSGQTIMISNCEAKRAFLKDARRLQSHPYFWGALMSVL